MSVELIVALTLIYREVKDLSLKKEPDYASAIFLLLFILVENSAKYLSGIIPVTLYFALVWAFFLPSSIIFYLKENDKIRRGSILLLFAYLIFSTIRYEIPAFRIGFLGTSKDIIHAVFRFIYKPILAVVTIKIAILVSNHVNKKSDRNE